MKEPTFLSLVEVLEIHKGQIERFGGDQGLRDLKLLESAVSMPQTSFQGEFLDASLFEMAAAYAYHISENQPFIDGNKRTGLDSALVFLDLNGIIINDPKSRLYDAMMDVGNKRMTKKDLAKVLEQSSHPR